jgi:hypothetical protein
MSKFQKGVSGNYQGRTPGIVDKRTQFRKLLEPHAPEIVAKLIEMAKEGEPTAMRLVVERLIPRVKDAPITFDLPEGDIGNAETLFKIGLNVIKGVAGGAITPEEAHKVASLLGVYQKVILEAENTQMIKDLKDKIANISDRSMSHPEEPSKTL